VTYVIITKLHRHSFVYRCIPSRNELMHSFVKYQMKCVVLYMYIIILRLLITLYIVDTENQYRILGHIYFIFGLDCFNNFPVLVFHL